jgi:hypothetical protein
VSLNRWLKTAHRKKFRLESVSINRKRAVANRHTPSPANLPVINDLSNPRFPVTASRENGVAVRCWSNARSITWVFVRRVTPFRLIPSPNHHAGYRQIGVDLVLGFLGGHGNGGDGDGDGPRAVPHPTLTCKIPQYATPQSCNGKAMEEG